MLAFLVAGAIAHYASTNIADYTQSNLRDISFKGVVVKGNQVELRKINSDFGQAYRFDYANVKLKEPFMLRIESIVEDQSVLLIGNGSDVLYKVPRANIKSRQSLAKAPGRRQSFLDFGILTPSLFESFFQAKFVRIDRATGEPIFDLSYQLSSLYHDTSRHRLWVDPERHIAVKSEWYNQQGDLLATFYYNNPKNFGGVWVPTDLVVKNAEGNFAGETRYEGISVNSGISSSLFNLN